MSTTEDKKNLYSALLKAQQSIDTVKKDATNAFGNYDYVSAEEMIKITRQALQKNGLAFFRKSWSYTPEGDGYCVKSNFCLVHCESGEILETENFFPAFCRKGTPIDKALCSALTSSLSYYLRDLLMIAKFSKHETLDTRNDLDYLGAA